MRINPPWIYRLWNLSLNTKVVRNEIQVNRSTQCLQPRCSFLLAYIHWQSWLDPNLCADLCSEGHQHPPKAVPSSQISLLYAQFSNQPLTLSTVPPTRKESEGTQRRKNRIENTQRFFFFFASCFEMTAHFIRNLQKHRNVQNRK